ncbi:MAG TPA: hypothetical protein VF184_11050 [Phycisphaeraceae bacterium]
MDVADPPLLEHLLLERPWPLVIALLAVAAAVQVAARRRSSRRAGWAAWLIAAGAAGVALLAYTVTTDRERLTQLTVELVQAATQPVNLAVVDQTLHPDAVLRGPGGQVWMPFQNIRWELEQAVQRLGVTDHAIRQLGVEASGDRGRSALALRTHLGETGMPVSTSWNLVWQRQSEGDWRIVEIQWLTLQDQPPTRGMWQW